MKLQIVLLTVLVTVLPSTHTHDQGGSNHMQASRYHCNWINNRYRCTYENCSITFDGKKNCTTRVGPPTAEILAKAQSQLNFNRYRCRWVNEKMICTYQNCTISVDGKKNCTSREGPPSADIDQKLYQAHRTNTSCNWDTGKLICTVTRCTISPNGHKSCSSTKT